MRSLSSLILLLLTGFVIHGQSSLTYNGFLSVVRQTNPLSKKAYNNRDYATAQYKAAKGNFDPQLSSFIDNKFFNSKDYFTVAGAELRQPLYTSQYLKAGYQYGQGPFVNPENSTPLAGIPYLGLQASLLQGLLFDKNRAEVIKGKYYADYFTAEEKIQLNDLLFVSSNTYLDYLYAEKINDLYGYFASLADQRLKGITQLSAIGERPTIDTVEAAIFLQGRVLDKKSGELELVKKYNELVVLSGDLTGANQLQVSDSLDLVFEMTKKTIARLLPDQNAANPILAQYIAKQKVLDTEARLKREMIKPVLDINYNFLNNRINDVYPVLSTSNYKWGATFSLPLYLRKPRHEYKMAKLISANNELELINKQNQINYKRAFILDALQLVAEQIENANRSATYSKVLVEAEKLKFTSGESSLFLLNAREAKWLESELKLAGYKAKYVKTVLELIYVDGSLQYELMSSR